MTPMAFVYDPTAADEQSKVRGIGRYLQTLREQFQAVHTHDLPAATSLASGTFTFTNELKKIPKKSVFINPFFNLYQKPLKIGRIASKQIAVIHDLIPLKYKNNFPVGLKGWFFKLLNTWSLKNYDLIVTDSEVSKKDIIRYLKIPEKRIKVIYPTVSELFLPHLDTNTESVEHHHPFHTEGTQTVPEYSVLPPEKVTANELIKGAHDFVLYVGDGTWNKNLPRLAQTIRMANIPCVCVGKVFAQPGDKAVSAKPHPWGKSLAEFHKLVQNNPLFIFPGYVSDVELMLLYKKARINLLPSIDEGFGLSYIEAGYMSTPSLLGDTPVFHEIAHNAAIFGNVGDPKDMAKKLVELFYDSVALEKLKIAAFDRAQTYSPERFRSGWMEAIQQLSG